MKKIYVLAVCLLTAVVSINAQKKQWTLRECIDYATEHNIDIMKQAVAVKQAEVDVSTSKNSRLPDLNGSIGQSFIFGQSVPTFSNLPMTGDITKTSGSLSVNMPLFTGFKIENDIKRRELSLQSSIEGLNKAKENIQIQVAGYYLDVLFKKEILKVYKQQVSLSQGQVERTQILVDAGKVPASQLYDAKAQLAKDELNVTTATNDLDLSLLNLAQSLNMMQPEIFDIQEPIVGDVVGNNMRSIMPADEVYRIAIAERPHIKEAVYQLESSKRSLKVAQSGYWPNLSLGLNYGTSFNRGLSGDINFPSISSQISGNQSKLIGLNLAIPIFDRFVTRNNVRTARLNIQNAELAVDNVKLSLFKEIQQAYQSATAAQAKYISSEKAVEAAQTSFNYAQDRYNLGKSTVFELNDARTKLFSSLSDQAQAKYEYIFRAKILDFYSAKPIEVE